MPFAATWMDLEIIILSEVSQKEKDKYYMISLIVESKMWHKWTYLWNRNRLTDNREQTCDCQGGGGVGKEWIQSLGLADANYCI